MDRKELIAILVLAGVVAIAATFRLSGHMLTQRNATPRPQTNTPQPGTSTRDASVGAGVGRLIWPRPRRRYEPRGREARALFNAIERIFAEGLLDASAAAYRYFIERYPDEPTVEVARFRIGQCHTLGERYAEAAKHYDLFLNHHPRSDLRPMALLWSGVGHMHQGDIALARNRFEELVASYPGTPFADGARRRLAQLGPKS